MTDSELGWLAGILEGEACFGTNLHPKENKRHIKVQVSMSDPDIVNRIALLVGLPLDRVRRRAMGQGKRGPLKDQYGLNICGRHAAQVMRAIRPLMGERRGAKIDELLELDATPWRER